MKELAKALNRNGVMMTRTEKVTQRILREGSKHNLDFLVNQFKPQGADVLH